MPLPSTRVVHPDWSAHHRPVAAGGMTATCRITAPVTAPGDWNPDNGSVAPVDGAQLYTGPCRVQPRQPGTRDTADVAGQPVATRDYLVQLDGDVTDLPAGEYGAVVTITACADDPLLVGRRLRVRLVDYGSLRWLRDVWCRDDLTNTPGDPPTPETDGGDGDG